MWSRRNLLRSGGVILGGGAASCMPAASSATPAPDGIGRFVRALRGGSLPTAAELLAPNAAFTLWGERIAASVPGEALQHLVSSLRDAGLRVPEALGAGNYLVQGDRIEVALEGRSATLSLILQSGGSNDGRIRELILGNIPAAAQAVSVRDFGARGDGRTDDSAAIAAGYAELERRGGGTLLFPPGTYRCHIDLRLRTIQLQGAGGAVSVLTPVVPERPILAGNYTTGEWNEVRIAGLGFVGLGGKGTAFRAAGAGIRNGEYAGRTRFADCDFGDLSICIERPLGQIGLWIEHCRFRAADYHLVSRGMNDHNAERLRQDAMHSGVMTVAASHFVGARVASCLIDSAGLGSGQFLFDNCVMELNPGLVFDIRRINGRGGLPGILVRHCWNEQNGGRVNGLYARIVDTPQIRFEDTPIGSMVLRNAHVTTQDCSLALAARIERDARSTILHVRARSDGDVEPAGLVESVASSTAYGPNRASSFQLRLPDRVDGSNQDAVLTRLAGSAPVVLTGSVLRRTVPIDGSPVPGLQQGQLIELAPGETLFPTAVAVRPDHWVAWTYIYRLLEGAVPQIQVSGQIGVSGARDLSSSQWEMLGGIAHLETGSSELSIWHTVIDGPARIHLAGLALLQFSTAQAALSYLNGRTFPA